MQSVKHYIDLMFYRAYAEMRDEATRAYLGFAWWVVEPLLYLGVFYIVFAKGLKGGGPEFVPLMLVGMVVWKWFGSTVLSSATVLNRNSGIMQQVYLPKMVLVGVTVVLNTLKFFFVLVVLLAYLTLMHEPVTVAWTALPLLIFVELILTVGISMLVAAVIPLAPDLNMVLDNFMMMVFFMSGVFFDITGMSGILHDVLLLNPVAVLIINYRMVLLDGTWPSLTSLGWISIMAVLFLAIGAALLVKYDRVYPKLMA